MQLHVKFFAMARDRAGVSQITLSVSPGATVQSVAQILVDRYPALHDLLPRVAFAVNMSYVDRGHVVRDNDELAVIPPVSGG